MPLAHPSTSHGSVAFGFFNIHSHMLLLEQLFFFADAFCQALVTLARQPDLGPRRVELPGWRITAPGCRGDLHGAIAGVELSGFIGATYQAYPFPARAEDFRQRPEHALKRDQVEAMIAPFGQAEAIELAWRGEQLELGPYAFSVAQFALLVAYVDRGGYPRWLDDHRPAYVRAMIAQLARAAPRLVASVV